MDLADFLEKYLGLSGISETEEWVNSYCPTHDERRRSFGVHRRTLVAKCYVCGKMPLYKLIQKVRSISKVEALTLIRKELDRNYTGKGTSVSSGKRNFQSRKVRELSEELEYYRGQYAKYMTKHKGFTKEILKEFEIFYNDEDKRLLFPVREGGKLVGMMYRNPFDEGDYWYNDDFDRQKYVYNLDNAERGKTIIIVESPKDVAWMKQAGIANVVSVFGTNFGPKQVKKIKAVTSRVCFAMDNDKGGMEATVNLFKAFVGCIKYRVDLEPYGDPGDMELEEIRKRFVKPKLCFKV